MPNLEDPMVREEMLHGCQVTTVEVASAQAAEALGKAIGSYLTITPALPLDDPAGVEPAGECLAEILNRTLQFCRGGTLCICGIGNPAIQADALGPEVVCRLPLQLLSEAGRPGAFRQVCSFSPGTALTNNIRTELLVAGAVRAMGADAALLVDSLLTGDPAWLFRTIQVSTAGGLQLHLPGRRADWSVLGVPVISLGVPALISLSALAPGLLPRDEMLTGMHIRDIISAAGTILSYAILRVCWPSLSRAECFIYSKLPRDPVPYSPVLHREPAEIHH